MVDPASAVIDWVLELHCIRLRVGVTVRQFKFKLYGVGARGCGNGLFPTYEIPKSYLSFTILVSFILVKYPDRDPDRRPSEYGTYGMYLRYVPTNSYGMPAC